MHISSSVIVLSASALIYSGKLRNTFNGLCLDAPNGISRASSLNLCFRKTIGFGSKAKKTKKAMMAGDVRTGRHPNLWNCNFGNGQLFLREPNTRPGTLSFMTSYSVDKSRAYELAVLSDDGPGAPANFLPVNSTSNASCVKYEWITFN
ncbi:hypothetical protein EDD21DRAFT_409782 [Dissophora ornata]|nr:hypothetical protein EDD21DRAFT_409782 [Dissophora ornata]